jgi:nucleoside-diphosphate-sugar epimerase
LGRKLVPHLRQAGEKVVAVGHAGSEAAALDASVDCTDCSQIDEIIRRFAPDVIVHLAATLTAEFDSAYALNVCSSRFILESVERAKLRTRTVLIGSAAEYGIVAPEENPISVSRRLDPVSIYGLTKAWQTQLMTMFAARGLDVLVARIFTLDGPGLSTSLFAGRVRRQAEELLAGKSGKIVVGPLSAVRDYISTDDGAEQVIAVARSGSAGRVYHVASGIPLAMGDLLDRILREFGLDRSHVDSLPANTNRKGLDVPIIYADLSRTPWRHSGMSE